MSGKRRTRSTTRPDSGTSNRDEPSSPAGAPAPRDINWREHIGATIGLVATAYVAAKILTISNYSPETAYGFLRATGAVSVGVGAMLTFVPVLAGLVWAAGVVLQVRSFAQTEPVPIWRWPVLAALTAFAAFVAPMVYMLAFLVLGLLVWTVHKDTRPDRESSARWIYVGLATVVAVGILLPALFSRAPWLPPEQIDIHGQAPFTAYVLAEESGTVTVLYEDPRQIDRIEESRLQSRSICQLEESPFWRLLGAPVWAVFTNSPDYPRCPADTAPPQPQP